MSVGAQTWAREMIEARVSGACAEAAAAAERLRTTVHTNALVIDYVMCNKKSRQQLVQALTALLADDPVIARTILLLLRFCRHPVISAR